MKEQLTAVFQQVPEGYIGFVEELPGVNTQGDTLDEARTNLQEAVQLVLESNRARISGNGEKECDDRLDGKRKRTSATPRPSEAHITEVRLSARQAGKIDADRPGTG